MTDLDRSPVRNDEGEGRLKNVHLVTAWDFWGDYSSGMARFYRGLEGDGSELKFTQHIYRARIGRDRPPLVRHLFALLGSILNRKLMGELRALPWMLGGQQFVHLMSKEDLRNATVVVFDLLDLDYPDYEKTGLRFASYKKLLSNICYAARIITISQYSKRRIVAHFDVDPRRVLVVPLGVNLDRFRPVCRDKQMFIRRQLGLQENAFIVTYVGSEHRRKNLSTLVQALSESVKQVPDLTFVKIGKPQSETGHSKFLAMLQKTSILEHSRLVDYVTDDQLPDWYAATDVFAFPSVGEGFGVPLLEAMSSGVPIITTRSCAIPEVVGRDAIFVNDPYSVREWSNRLIDLANSWELRRALSESGRIRAQSFSWNAARRIFIEAFFGGST